MRHLHSPWLMVSAVCACASFDTAAADDLRMLDPVLVTASRSSETVSETLAAVTVITREDIDRLQPRDVQDLLVGLPGVSIASNGGPGKSSSLFLRGTESDHTLVLLDGVKIGSATSGGAALEQIPVDQIDRIEIVRGPRSSLYGSEAIGGVIQIFTRRGSAGEASSSSFALGAGNLGSAKAELGLRGSIGRGGWYGLGLSARTTDGVDVRPSLSAAAGRDADDDGYRNQAATLRAGWHFDNGAELSANWLRAEGRNEFDGSAQNQTDSVSQVIGSRLGFSPMRRWHVGLTAGQSRDESDNYSQGVFASRFDTTREHYSWQNDIELATTQMLIAGVDYLQDEIDSTTGYAVDSRDNTGAFLQYQGEFGAVDLQLSARHDDNQQFGESDTGSAAVGYEVGGGLRISAGYGNAFKAPTFNELYFPGFGNPDARPEKARNAEIGIGGLHGRYSWNLSAFRTEIDQLLSYNAATMTSINIDEALIRGVEAQAAAALGPWNLKGYFTWLDPENLASGANHGKQLPRRAKQTGRLELDRRFGALNLGATWFASGERFDNASNATRLGGYSTLALRADYRFAERWLVQAEGQNVLDKTYVTAATYALPGSTVFLTLRYTPAF